MIRAIRHLLILSALLVLSLPAPAFASADQVIRDCARDGRLDHDYSNAELRRARDNLPADLDEYSDCRDVIANAIKGGSDLGGGAGSPGVGATDPAGEAAATAWWEELTAAGGEGVVVKPAANLTRGRRGYVQPGLKVRGREYLRLVYGPDYTEPRHLDRLRERSLGRKRGLALREYALGQEGLERLARGEPLWRVHECVFAVLALESEPVDPRL